MTGIEESFRSGMDPDQLLAELRAETPEMPADFHASWKRAVGEEMKRAAENKPAEKPASRGWGRPWRSLAGVAAIMVFLLGGTLLTRGRWTREVRVAEPADVRLSTANLAGKERKTQASAVTESDAVMEAEEALDSAEAVNGTAVPADRGAAESVDRAAAPAAMESAAVLDTETVMESETAVDWTAEAAPIGAAEALEAAGTMKAAESSEAAETEKPAAENRAAEPGFWADLGQFILHAWPIPAGAAVLIGAAAWIRKRKRAEH